jgi:LmbE family N-acetylglucosaminyl deacetylase
MSATGVPLLVVSAHFDDAVLSCGHLLASCPGAVVATVCGGLAPIGTPAAPWDAESRWPDAHAATLGRRQEDAEALSILGAKQVCLDLLDEPYRLEKVPSTEVASAVRELVIQMRPERVLIPLGFRAHGDHVLTRDGSSVALLASSTPVHLYVDLPYHVTADAEEISELIGARRTIKRIASATEQEAKRKAVSCYRSQRDQLVRAFAERYTMLIHEPEAETFLVLRE